MTLKGDAEFEEPFHQSLWKSQNLDFDGILLIQSRKGMSVKSSEDLCYDNEEWCKD